MKQPSASPVMEIAGLSKVYSSLRGNAVTAIDSLDLVVQGPGVHGFLGPNGSGKTTTIRCLLGLVRPSDGEVRLFGEPVSDLHKVISNIGALVETPKFFPNFSGRKNLRMLARVAGVTNRSVDGALDVVGLADRCDDSFKSYSLGMKQRLAVAATLLKDPDLIVLDEPANGLDPAGIVEIRQLLRSLADQGKTVFVSSHQLSEVQQTADVLTIINNGRVIRSGSVADVVQGASKPRMRIVIDDPAGAAAALERGGIIARVSAEADTVEAELDPAEGASISRLLAADGRYPRALAPLQADLESAFLELTGNAGGEVR